MTCTKNLSGNLNEIETEERIRVLEKKGYDINRILEKIERRRKDKKPPLFIHYRFIPDDRCKESFIDCIKCAKEEIKIASTDGMTFPGEIKDVIIEKLTKETNLKVKVLLRSRLILKAIEGGNIDSRSKLKNSIESWNKLRTELKNSNCEKGSLDIRFVINEEFGHLNGSLIIDNKCLRMNIHKKNEKATEGELIQIGYLTNMMPIINHYFNDAWALSVDIDKYMELFGT